MGNVYPKSSGPIYLKMRSSDLSEPMQKKRGRLVVYWPKTFGGKGYIRIDGKTDARQREELRARFQGDDNVKLAVLSLTTATATAGTSLTLTAAFLKPAQ
eukprot:scaffold84227_cov20-Tisochrysis_lutea.AAC.1